jgi:predicted metal-dependent HD superfamily phosphohydrolase
MSEDNPRALARRWAPLSQGLPELPGLLAELGRRYAEPHRAYHDQHHIEALARLYREVEAGPGWRVPVEVKLALLFHDAVYQPGRPDNEARSAELARERLAGCGVDVERVAAMVRATKTHDHLDDPGDHDLAHLLDADMAILGAEPERYATYLDQLRREFAAVPEPLFRRGRRAFVEAQLARPALFHTPYFAARYEARARANLEAELGSRIESKDP